MVFIIIYDKTLIILDVKRLLGDKISLIYLYLDLHLFFCIFINKFSNNLNRYKSLSNLNKNNI